MSTAKQHQQQHSETESLGLEQELTCSVCFEILYQPLTLLDCLHTFCGSCLREWFAWQAAGSTTPNPYTCPGCRAPVRATRPNATVTTLLDMYLRLNPDKVKSAKDREDLATTFKPGDCVIPPVNALRRPADSSSDDEWALREARLLSLRDANSSAATERRRTDRAHRHHAQQHRSEIHRQHRNAPPLGHSASIRSILSNSDVGESDLREEIIQQIEEEGMLDGIDIDNLTPAQEEEFSQRIVRAYRRRLEENQARRAVLRERHQASLDRTADELPFNSPPNSRLRALGGDNQARTASSTHPERLRIESSLRSSSRTSTGNHSRHATRPHSSPQIDVPSRPIASAASSPIPVPGANSRMRRTRATSGSVPSDVANNSSLGVMSASLPTTSLGSSPLRSVNPSPRPPLVPVIACARCSRRGIQYSLHYHCDTCRDGKLDICLTCYRNGKGCEAWMGPGHSYFSRYLLQHQHWQTVTLSPPHVLRARRYDRQTFLLATGAFCDVCFGPTNDCYWHCGVCNDGAWGYCNACVQKGQHCTHPLSGLVYGPLSSPAATKSLPHIPDPMGSVNISSSCNQCENTIPQTETRFHCSTCNGGDYDLCKSCHGKRTRRSTCAHGMTEVSYSSNERKMIAKRETNTNVSRALWSYFPDPAERTAPDNNEGGGGAVVGVEDELQFPRHAEIRNVRLVNADWAWGEYAGSTGLFPANHTREVDS